MFKKIITSLFNQPQNAQLAADALLRIPEADVSLFTSDNFSAFTPAENAVSGNILGGRANLVIGISNVATQSQGYNTTGVGGPMVGAISQSVINNMVSGHSDHGLPEPVSAAYRADVVDGSVYCSVKVKKENLREVEQVLHQNGAIHIQIH